MPYWKTIIAMSPTIKTIINKHNIISSNRREVTPADFCVVYRYRTFTVSYVNIEPLSPLIQHQLHLFHLIFKYDFNIQVHSYTETAPAINEVAF